MTLAQILANLHKLVKHERMDLQQYLGLGTYNANTLYLVFDDLLNPSDIRIFLGAKELYKSNVANGVARLDGDGKLPDTIIPDWLFGNLRWTEETYNPITNTPPLNFNAPNVPSGNYYVVSGIPSGQSNIPFGTLLLSNGDFLIATSTSWKSIDNSDNVMSVAGKIGEVILNFNDIILSANPTVTLADAYANILTDLDDKLDIVELTAILEDAILKSFEGGQYLPLDVQTQALLVNPRIDLTTISPLTKKEVVASVRPKPNATWARGNAILTSSRILADIPNINFTLGGVAVPIVRAQSVNNYIAWDRDLEKYFLHASLREINFGSATLGQVQDVESGVSYRIVMNHGTPLVTDVGATSLLLTNANAFVASGSGNLQAVRANTSTTFYYNASSAQHALDIHNARGIKGYYKFAVLPSPQEVTLNGGIAFQSGDTLTQTVTSPTRNVVDWVLYPSNMLIYSSHWVNDVLTDLTAQYNSLLAVINTKVNQTEVNAIINTHNTSGTSHADIREDITALEEDVNTAKGNIQTLQEDLTTAQGAINGLLNEVRQVGTTQTSFVNGKLTLVVSDNVSTYLAYDTNGNIQKITETYADGKSYETTYTKDVEGRIKTMTKAEV